MTNHNFNGRAVLSEKNTLRRPKFGTFLQSDPNIVLIQDNKPYINYYNHRHSNASNPSPDLSPENSPSSSSSFFMSPINQDSPFTNSPWFFNDGDHNNNNLRQGLIGSLVREEGHIYSLASSGNLLYTGSDSKNVRVWKNCMEFSGFKSSSGLVKAIIVSGEKIYTGHQDGKIRVWRYSDKKGYKRVNNLPTTKDYIKSSLNPRNYVEVRRHRNVPWIRHYDAVSCMSLDEERGLLYSGSWDKTMKVWRLSDSKCLESVSAHDDAVNSVVVGFDGLVFTGSADGSVKVWRMEVVGKVTKHVLVDTLLKQENAVTAVAVNTTAAIVYAGTSDGLVNYWEREKRSLVHGGVVRGHKLAVLCLATAGSLVFSGSADKSICVWKREEGGIHTCLSVLTGHSGPVKCLTIEEDHEKEDGAKGDQRWIVYSGSLDRSVKVWRLSENTPPQVVRKSVDEIHAPPLTVFK